MTVELACRACDGTSAHIPARLRAAPLDCMPAAPGRPEGANGGAGGANGAKRDMQPTIIEWQHINKSRSGPGGGGEGWGSCCVSAGPAAALRTDGGYCSILPSPCALRWLASRAAPRHCGLADTMPHTWAAWLVAETARQCCFAARIDVARVVE